MTQDISDRIMSQLPKGGPLLYRRIGELVVRSWSDVALREVLRGAPGATLARHGIELPPGTMVRVVSPREAQLPTPDLLLLPLPPPGAPPVAAAEARRRLDATPFRWLCGDATQLVTLDAVLDPQLPAVGAGAAARAARWWRTLVDAIALQGRVAVGGAALALIAAFLVASRRGFLSGDDALAGLARPGAATFALSLAVVALISVAVAMRRR